MLGLLRGLGEICPPEEVVVYLREGMEGDPELPRWPGCRYLPVPGTRSKAGRVMAELAGLSGLDGRIGADLSYSPTSYLPLSPRVPSVATVVDLCWRRMPETVPLVRRLSLRLRMRPSLKWAAGLVAISEEVRRDVLALYGGRLRAPIRVMPLGVDSRFLEIPEGRPARSPDPESGHQMLIVSSGGTDPRKGIETLLDAFTALPVAFCLRTCLTILGPRDPRRVERLLQRIDPARRARVTFPGFLPIDEVLRLFARADLFVYPSRYEGFGLPVLEAMAAGIPVVCSDLPVLREVGGEEASYFEVGASSRLAEKVVELLASRAAAATAGESGRERARTFTWRRSASVLLEVLREVWTGEEARQRVAGPRVASGAAPRF